MSSGLRDISVTFGSRGVILLISLANQSALAWFLGVADRGSYAICMVFATLLSLVFSFGCDIASTYMVAAKKYTLSEGVVNSAVQAVVSSAIAVAAGLLIMKSSYPFLDKAAPDSFKLALLYIPFLLIVNIFLSLLTSIRKFTWFALLSIGLALFQLIFTVIFVWKKGLGVNGAILANILASAIVIVASYAYFLKRCEIRWVMPSSAKLTALLSYGIRYYMGRLSNQVNFQVGTMILAFFASPGEVGLFAVGSGLVARVSIVPDTLFSVLFPKVSGEGKGQARLVAQGARVSLIICALILLAIALAARPLVKYLFSMEFIAAVDIIRILALGMSIRFGCKVFVSYLIGMNHPGITSVAILIGTGLNLLLLWVLMPIFGLNGAAWAMTLGYIASSAVLTLFFWKKSDMSMLEIWRFRRSDWALLGQFLERLRSRTSPVR